MKMTVEFWLYYLWYLDYSRVPNKQGGVIKGEDGKTLKKNKRGGPNKRGGLQISEN